MPFNQEISQLEIDLNYFELTKASVINIQNNYQTLTNIKNTKEERKLNRAVAILTLITILQLFPELSLAYRLFGAIFIIIVILLIF